MTASIRDERFEELRAGFRRWFRISCVLLAFAVALITITYGEQPVIKVGTNGRTAIAALAAVALIGFAFNGGMLVGERLLRRYSPTWKGTSDRPR